MKIDTTIPGTSVQIIRKIPSYSRTKLLGGITMSAISAWFKRGLVGAAEAVTGTILNENEDNEKRALHVSVEGFANDTEFNMNINDTLTGTGSQRKIVTAAGTRVQLIQASTPCQGVIIQALRTNTDVVTVGFSDVVGSSAARQGIYGLKPGQSCWIPVPDVSLLYLDSVANGEGVMFTPFNRSE